MSENVAPKEQNPLVTPKTPSAPKKPQASQESTDPQNTDPKPETPSETPKPQASQESTDPQNADHKAADSVSDLQNFSTLRTILVDDQHSFVMMMKVILNTLGISKIDVASSADQALKICRKNIYDLYLFDYNLGDGLNGRQLMEKLREENHIPYYATVLIVTGDNSRAMVLSAIEQEPDDYVIKPFSHSQFKARLTRAMNKRMELMPFYKAQAEGNIEYEVKQLESLISNNTKYSIFCRCLLAGCYIEKKDYKLAQATLEEGLSMVNSCFLHQKLGELFYLEKKYDDAIAQLEQVVNRYPFMTSALKYLTYAYTDNKQLDMALKTIKHAVLVSPMSVTLLQLQIEMAIKNKDYLAARDACAMLLEVNKYFPNEVENMIGCFSQMEFQFAQSSNEVMHISNIQKHLRNITTRYKKYTNPESFNNNLFESIYQARIQIVKGENGKAKRVLYKCYNACEEDLAKTSKAIVEHMRIGFNQLGEYEVSDHIGKILEQNEKQNKPAGRRLSSSYEISSDLLDECVNSYLKDQSNTDRRSKYLELNNAGIKAYKDGDLETALTYFKDALKKLPSNTNALLNKVQVNIDICNKLAKSGANDSATKTRIGNILSESDSDLSSIDGLALSQAQAERTHNLRLDIDRLKQKFKMR